MIDIFLLIELVAILLVFMIVADFVLAGACMLALLAMCDLIEWYTNKLTRWRHKGGNPRDSSL